jgi:ubiquinol-cytochrome c reductase iron-sulfur subunit
MHPHLAGMAQAVAHTPARKPSVVARRDFLIVSAAAFAAVGTVLAIWPILDSLNPSADVLASGTSEIDLAPIAVGQRITVKWRGRPVFISHRSPAEIAEARAGDHSLELIDPERDASRVKNPEWLIIVGVCTHLGCIPLGQRVTDNRGPYAGWYCPCHGSIYDTSGRVRHGPAPSNLVVPPYRFVSDTRVVIG